MRATLVIITALALGCVGARAEVFSTRCSYGDAATKATFSIAADTSKKTGVTDYRNPDLKAVPGKLDILSVTNVEGGLVGIKLRSRATGTTYRVDYVKPKRPSNSPYTADMESVAVSGPGGTTHESCGLGR